MFIRGLLVLFFVFCLFLLLFFSSCLKIFFVVIFFLFFLCFLFYDFFLSFFCFVFSSALILRCFYFLGSVQFFSCCLLLFFLVIKIFLAPQIWPSFLCECSATIVVSLKGTLVKRADTS